MSQTFLPLAMVADPPSSSELIAQALAGGRINAETALIYRTYAVFGDQRLPTEFRGTNDPLAHDDVGGEIVERFAQLSPGAQATLMPFVSPPFYQGSWWDLQRRGQSAAASTRADTQKRCGVEGTDNVSVLTDWNYIDSPGGRVRVWWQARYPADQEKARQFAAEIDQIWLKLAGLMRREPLSDNGSKKFCRGGDDKMDVSLVDIEANGYAWPFDDRSDTTPAQLLISRRAGLPTLAHELMHAFQFAYDVKGTWDEYDWWTEATASWAVHYVYPSVDYEHHYAMFMLDHPDLPLETRNEQYHHYGAYLLPFFIQMTTGQVDMVRTSWEQFELRTDSLAAVNSVLPGGFAQQWAPFAAKNWNHEPVDDYFKTDRLPFAAEPWRHEKVELNGSPERVFQLDGEVDHLAARVYRYRFTDESARTVTFYNGLGFNLAQQPFHDDHGAFGDIRGETLMWSDVPANLKRGLHVTALLKVGGQWKEQDWTSQPYQSLCRDRRDERLEELVLIVSNSEWQDRTYKLAPLGLPSTLTVSNLGCYQWTGRVSGERTNNSATANNRTVTTAESVVWERLPLEVQSDSSGASYLSYSSFVPVDGSISIDTSGSSINTGGGWCSYEGGTSNVQPAAADGPMVIYSHARSVADGNRLYFSSALNKTEFTTETTAGPCPSGKSIVGPWFYFDPFNQKTASQDGRTIKNSIVRSSATSSLKLDWSLTAKRQ